MEPERPPIPRCQIGPSWPLESVSRSLSRAGCSIASQSAPESVRKGVRIDGSGSVGLKAQDIRDRAPSVTEPDWTVDHVGPPVDSRLRYQLGRGPRLGMHGSWSVPCVAPPCHGERPSNLDAAVRQIDITPSECYQFASTCSGECCEGHGSAENRILVLGSLDQSGNLRWRRNLHLRALHPWRCRPGCRGGVNPSPLHRLATGGRKNAVVLVDRGRRESVVQPPSIGRIDDVRLELSQLDVSQDRPDAAVDLPAILVERTRTLTPLPRLEPLVEQLAHCGGRAVELARLDLRHQSGERLCCSTLARP